MFEFDKPAEAFIDEVIGWESVDDIVNRLRKYGMYNMRGRLMQAYLAGCQEGYNKGYCSGYIDGIENPEIH